MKKFLILVALLAGLSSAFGFGCNSYQAKKLQAKFAELVLVSHGMGANISNDMGATVAEEFFGNQYTTYNDIFCKNISITRQRIECGLRRAHEKYKSEFIYKMKTFNLTNVQKEIDETAKEFSRICK